MYKQEAYSIVKDGATKINTARKEITTGKHHELEKKERILVRNFTSWYEQKAAELLKEAVVVELPMLDVTDGFPKILEDRFGKTDVSVIRTLTMEPNQTLMMFDNVLLRCPLKLKKISAAQSQDTIIVDVTIYILINSTLTPGKYTYMCLIEEGKLSERFIGLLTFENGNIAPYVPDQLKDTDIPHMLQVVFREIREARQAFLIVLCWADNLLRCKNISLVDIKARPVTKKQRRRIKDGNVFDTDYKIIHIHPNKKYVPPKSIPWQRKNEVAMSTVDVKMGHFKTYTKERPLFGKHVGTYWWSPILKTDADKVIYKVKESV